MLRSVYGVPSCRVSRYAGMDVTVDARERKHHLRTLITPCSTLLPQTYFLLWPTEYRLYSALTKRLDVFTAQREVLCCKVVLLRQRATEDTDIISLPTSVGQQKGLRG